MKAIHLILLLNLLTTGAMAQKLKWDDTSFNFGTVRDWDSPPASFRFTNTGRSKLMFLPKHYGRDVQVVFPDRSIAPGETAEVLVHYYTPDTGPFSKNVEIWSNASDRPETITLRGNIASLRNNALTACPTFHNEMPAASSGVNTIVVIDRVTGEQIAGAKVELFKKKQSRATYQSDQRGLVRSKLESGAYTLQADKEGYFPTVQEISFERKQGNIIVFMEPVRVARAAQPVEVKTVRTGTDLDLGLGMNDQWDERPASAPQPKRAETVAVPRTELGISANDQWNEPVRSETPPPKSTPPARPSEDMGLNINDQWAEQEADVKKDEEPAEQYAGGDLNAQWHEAPRPVVSAPLTESPPTAIHVESTVEAQLEAMAPKGEFSVEEFRANNIVLLLDASSSMRKNGKLDLLKGSAARMIGMMRDVDRLTVIAFNITVWTVIRSTPVTEHQTLIDRINELEAEGYTSGVKGMKEAYAQLTESWVDGGNNQLILVTDGMFNSSSFSEKDAVDLAAQQAGRGIILSLVGYSEDKDAEKMMKRIARRGNGSYIQIDGANDPVSVLAEEIKMRSRKL